MVVAPAVSDRLTLMMSVRSSAQSRARTREFAGLTRLRSFPVARSKTTTSGDPPGSLVQATRCPFGDSRTIDISGSVEKALAGGGAARTSTERNSTPAASPAATQVLMVNSLTARKIPFGEPLGIDPALSIRIAPRALTLGSERREPAGDGLALPLVRHAAGGGLDILRGMARVPCGREDDRDGGLSKHPLDEQLCGAPAAEFRRDGWQGVPGRTIDHGALRKGAVHQHGNAEFACDRHQARAGFRLGDRVIDLHEIRLFPPYHALEHGVGACEVMRDADVAHGARPACGPERCEVRVEILQVMDLHEVEFLCAHEPVGIRKLALA